jgi:hypothetical protein
MTVGNTPMIEGAKKFGYTYVDTAGTTYIESHPDAAGHVHIANLIMEALPDREIYNKISDVKPGHKYYNDVEFVLKNGIMSAQSTDKFNPDANITKTDLNKAFNKINGTDNDAKDTTDATVKDFVLAILNDASQKDFMSMVKSVALAYRVMAENEFKLDGAVTRGKSANYFKSYSQI